MAAGMLGQPESAMPLGRNANAEPGNTSERPKTPSVFKIDVGRNVAEIERTLRAGADFIGCMEGLAILRRWQFDEMLDDGSRRKARLLVREFASKGPVEVWRR